MGIKNFAISTNHPFNKYKPGETVKGKIHFNLSETKNIRGIYVKLKGLAKVSWTEKSSGSKGSTTYQGKHEYFEERIYFLGSRDGESFDLEPGDYDYKFDYVLPYGLPSTYKDNYGSVKYTVKCVVDIPWGFDDEEEIDLDIISAIDLNTKPQSRNPVHTRTSKHMCILCCQSGPLNMEINIPKRGFVPGDSIELNVDIENTSNTNVDGLTCKLKQTVTSYSETPSRHTRETDVTLCEYRFEGVPKRRTKNYNEKLMISKDIVPLNFEYCNILDVKYELKISADISGCHLDLSSELRIELGNVAIIGRGEPSAPSISILAGLGTPYPFPTEEHYEIRRSNTELASVAPILYPKNFGWTTELKT